ncbi:MAG TPA: glucosaminidase domain-containing protein [Woeseiaceae bacterium]|nr:glucosaminidase domain-containing protein [Woeseiaceae bacterium]
MKVPTFIRSILLLSFAGHLLVAPVAAQEVVVFGGPDEARQWLTGEDWWGEEKRGEQLTVPRAIITGINPSWRQTARELTVPDKKEVFYRFMLPLVVHANDMVLDRRAKLENARRQIEAGERISEDELQQLRDAAVLLRVLDNEEADALTADSARAVDVIDQLLYRLDVIPAGLVLGQAAYESGYGTSRFAVEGNALFGQWTYGGQGLKPEQQRKHLGDHRIASFDWPFDSVRGYFINLSSHPAYEDFRKLRAELRSKGHPLESLALADGLIRYSERGQEYVETLKSIIRVNNLDIADDAVFRDEPLRFLVGAGDPASAEALRAEIERLRASGELEKIVERMRLE